jgi:hypothetical protein
VPNVIAPKASRETTSPVFPVACIAWSFPPCESSGQVSLAAIAWIPAPVRDGRYAPEFNGLVAFMTVAEKHGFSAAARALGVSASAFSQALRNLETLYFPSRAQKLPKLRALIDAVRSRAGADSHA